MTISIGSTALIARPCRTALRLAVVATMAAAWLVQPAAQAGYAIHGLVGRSATPAHHHSRKGTDEDVGKQDPSRRGRNGSGKDPHDEGAGDRHLDGQGDAGNAAAIMPSEARDTMRLMLAGKIDQWFAKIDGSGAVFLMNVTDAAEAHTLLEEPAAGPGQHDDV